MAIIYSYPETLELLPTDMLIGTSTIRVAGKKKNITKNFTLELLKNFILDGNVGVQWGTITGTLSNQTDLQAALNAKQNNITLTTTGSTGPATLVGSTLNVPDYSTGINVPTLNQVLTVGNTSLLDLKAGNLYSYDNLNMNYGIVQFYDGSVSLKAATTNNLLFYNDATGTVSFSNGTYNPMLNFAGVGNNVYTFQNANGTLAFTSDIPSLAGYVPTSRTLTINGTSYDLTADRSWSVGTVTSVGLSMPSAFTVSSSPVTGSGTIAVAGAGISSQYIRGDGTLATFPTSTGGGSSFNYYLNGSISQGTFGGTPYYQMSRTPVFGAGTNFTRTNGAGNGYIASFITDAGDPSQLNIPGGNWNVEFYFNASSGGGSPSFYAELYKVDATNVFTLIASDSLNPEGITNGTVVDQYFTSIPVPQTTLLITDRLAVRIFVNTGGRTITLHTENSNLSEVLTTFSTGLTALNGLTQQVQYFSVGTSGTDFNISSVTDTHTFNLPTASAVNRGALSSTDWNTFNGKFTLPSFTSGSVLFSNGTTIAQDNANFFWDNTNNRLGIGTATPTRTLDVVGLARISGQIETQKITNLSTVSNVPADASLLLYAPTTTNYYGGIIGWAESNIAASISSYDDGSGGALGLALSTGNATSISEKMRITSAGNVAIGATTANARLDVRAPGALSTDIAFKIRNSANTADLFNVNGLGNVGIGPLTPTEILEVSSTATTGLAITRNALANASRLFFKTTGTYNWSIGLRGSRNDLSIFNETSIEALTINSTTNNVLINTTTDIPSSKLTVESTTQGFLPPRMTTTQRNAIVTPVTGLIVYDNTLLSLYQFNGTAWVAVGAGGGSTKSINSVSTNTAAGSSASTDYFYFASGTINITLPTAVGNNNNYVIKNVGTGTVTIDTTSSQTIDGSLTAPIKVQYLSLTLISDGANWNII